MMNVQFLRSALKQKDIIVEIAARIVIITIFIITDYAAPFRRKIQPEEVWLYRFPLSEDYIPFKSLQVFIIAFSLAVFWAMYQFNRKATDVLHAILGLTLSMYLSATVTNFIKLVVGRPRPDFFERCFQDPPEEIEVLAEALCDRDIETVDQGYKSFPSGHATMAFSGLSYTSLYTAYGLKVFSQRHLRFSSLRLCATITPVVVAVLVAASRTADYHHHWQDVLVGSFIGVIFAIMCFQQSFHGIFHKSTNLPLITASVPPKSPPPPIEVQVY